jgi:hypothetical protein
LVDDALVVQGEVDALGFCLLDYVRGVAGPKGSRNNIFGGKIHNKKGLHAVA